MKETAHQLAWLIAREFVAACEELLSDDLLQSGRDAALQLSPDPAEQILDVLRFRRIELHVMQREHVEQVID